AILDKMMLYPLLIGAICIICSIIGTFFVRLGKSNNIMRALYKGFVTTAVLSAVGIAVITYYLLGFDTPYTVGGTVFNGLNLFACCITGLVVTGLLMVITEYY